MMFPFVFAGLLLQVVTVTSQNVIVGKLLRFACSQLVIERTDPLVNPGLSPSPHTHQIVGGNSFNVTVGWPLLLIAAHGADKSRWILPRWNPLGHPLAPLARILKISPTTGLPLSIFALQKMALSSLFLNVQTLWDWMESVIQ